MRQLVQAASLPLFQSSEYLPLLQSFGTKDSGARSLAHLLNMANACARCAFCAAKQSSLTMVPSALARPLKAVLAWTPAVHAAATSHAGAGWRMCIHALTPNASPCYMCLSTLR